MKALLPFLILLTGCSTVAQVPTPSPASNPCPVHLPQGIPKGPAMANDAIVVRDIYCLANDPDTKFADFVAYRLDTTTLGTSGTDQEREWEPDPDLDPAVTLEPDDYKGAYQALGTDRGHLAPLASFRGVNWQQVNYLSNIVPQRSGFNRGVWQELESDIRDMARQGPVYVITGTAYLETMPTLPGADEPHVIPSGLWTIATTSQGTQAWYFDQDTNARTPEEGVMRLEALEEMVGLDFAENGYETP